MQPAHITNLKVISMKASRIQVVLNLFRRREKYARVFMQGQDQELPQQPISTESNSVEAEVS